MKWKKGISVLLAALCVFAGCAKGPETPPAAEEDGCAPPRGRFVETEITPRELAGKPFDTVGIFAHPDGSLDYFATIPDETQEPYSIEWVHYSSPDGGDTWQSVDMSWVEALHGRLGGAGRPFGGELCMDDEKNIYCLTVEQRLDAQGRFDQRSPLRLFRIPSGGQPKEIPVADFSDPAFYDGAAWAIDTFQRLPDGNFLLDFSWENRLLLIYDGETGERVRELPDFDMLPGPNNLYRANCFVTPVFDALRDGMELAAYDYSGQRLAAGPSLNGMYDEEMEFRLRGGQDGEIFLINREGISRTFSGGSYWETLMEGTQYRFGRGGVDILYADCDSANSRFYLGLRTIARSANGYPESALYRYAFDPSAVMTPEQEITVFSLAESETLTEAVAAFQMRYPDCRVAVKHPREGMPQEEAARILEKELSEGRGPDVALLDGLPLEKLRATGALADLSELADPEAYFGNLVTAFESGGKIDAIPARVAVPLMAGDKALLDTLRGLPDLVSAAELPEEEVPLFAAIERFYDPAYVLFGLYAPYLDGPKAGEKLLELLEGTKALWDRYGGELPGGEGLPQRILGVGFPMSAYYGGRARLGIEDCSRYSQLNFWSDCGYREEEGKPVYPALTLESLFGSGVYYPTHIAAVNAYGQHQERAKDFVRVLLSSEVQSVDPAISGDSAFGKVTNDGLPVNREAFAYGISRDPWMVFATDMEGLMASLDTPVLFRQRDRMAFLEALPAFYRGEKTAGEAAEKILAARQ